MKEGLPYRLIGGTKFYARAEVKDVLAYLRVLLNPEDTLSLLRVINVPARKKFLRARVTEASHVADVCLEVALARPYVRLTLVSNGRRQPLPAQYGEVPAWCAPRAAAPSPSSATTAAAGDGGADTAHAAASESRNQTAAA
jgi:DNA helicase-2/ATP-dependent DNA helicase PcrA